MTPEDIDVRYEPDHEPVFLKEGRPQLHWGYHPLGKGWTLSYVEPDGNGMEDHFIPGDLLDVDYAVTQAVSWLRLRFANDADADSLRTEGDGGP